MNIGNRYNERRSKEVRLIENMLLINVDDEEQHGLLIHTLSGNISVLSKQEKEYIQSWKGKLSIEPTDESERGVYRDLMENGYLSENAEAEARIVDSILSKCRNKHEDMKRHNADAAFVLTYKCNYACPYCYEHALDYVNNKILTNQMVDKIFSIYNEHLENILLYGGEPFLPETKQVVEYIILKAPDAIYSIITNGYYLSDFVGILIKLKVKYIMVTLDGPKELHDRTRILKNGRGTYERVMKGIKLCLEQSIPIKIRMNISHNNVEQCIRLREKLISIFSRQYEAGILMFELQPIFQSSSKVKSNLNEIIFFDNSLLAPIPYNYNRMSLSLSPVLKMFANNAKMPFRPRYCNCDAEGRQMFYDAEGNIYSCTLSLRNEAASIGKYYPDYSLKKNSIFTRNIESVEQCKNCKLKFLCGGGCANAIIDADGNAMKPNCSAIQKEVYYELPRLFKKYMQDRRNTGQALQ